MSISMLRKFQSKCHAWYLYKLYRQTHSNSSRGKNWNYLVAHCVFCHTREIVICKIYIWEGYVWKYQENPDGCQMLSLYNLRHVQYFASRYFHLFVSAIAICCYHRPGGMKGAWHYSYCIIMQISKSPATYDHTDVSIGKSIWISREKIYETG